MASDWLWDTRVERLELPPAITEAERSDMENLVACLRQSAEGYLKHADKAKDSYNLNMQLAAERAKVAYGLLIACGRSPTQAREEVDGWRQSKG